MGCGNSTAASTAAGKTNHLWTMRRGGTMVECMWAYLQTSATWPSARHPPHTKWKRKLLTAKESVNRAEEQ